MPTCMTKTYMAMTEEEKLEFYKQEYNGAPLAEMLSFRCTKLIATWLKTKGMEEGRDYSAVIRRLVTKAASEEGFSKDG